VDLVPQLRELAAAVAFLLVVLALLRLVPGSGEMFANRTFLWSLALGAGLATAVFRHRSARSYISWKRWLGYRYRSPDQAHERLEALNLWTGLGAAALAAAFLVAELRG